MLHEKTIPLIERMNKRSKIIFGLIGISILAIAIFIAVGLHAMAIEDHFGDNQEFFYKSKHGDIALNRDTREFKKIEKSWARAFVIDNKKVDLWTWLDKNRIEIYRARTLNNSQNPNYSDIEQLIRNNELEMIVKNW